MDRRVPRVATVAINVKGADLLFLDHLDDSDLEEADRRMWRASEVDVQRRPFGRVLNYVPLADDGLNLNTLRNNRGADVEGYSQTRQFALGISAIWPYMHLFFDDMPATAVNLLADIESHFEEQNEEVEDGPSRPFTLAEILNLFNTAINTQSRGERWKGHALGTIRAVQQRFQSLPAVLGGLIDVTGTGFGLDELARLRAYDVAVVDLERIMANARDPRITESAIKIVTAHVLGILTEAMTQRSCPLDHIIVFADELNRLAPRGKSAGGIGEYLAQLARTTRDRGVVLFGAGQFRSGIHEDLLKAASVHYSMQTPDYELNDSIYSSLSPEFKARLTQLRPGETLLQYPSLRTAVFARFPRPFVLAGALKWRERFPAQDPLPVADCIAERLRRLDPDRPPQVEEVRALVDGLPASKRRECVADLRLVEMRHAVAVPQSSSHRASRGPTPWQQFSKMVTERLGDRSPMPDPQSYTHIPRGTNNEEDWDV